MRPESVGTYARRLEQALCRLRGTAVVLSPRDWRLITEWHRREVPLSLILDTLEELARGTGRGRRARPPRSLGAVARAVEEAWRVWREGRVVAAAGEAAGPRPLGEACASWQAVERRERETPLGRVLRELLLALERGEDPAELDRRLDRELVAVAPGPRVRAARDAAEHDLSPHRSRMPAGALAATLERAVVDLLRRELGLPRLALSDRSR